MKSLTNSEMKNVVGGATYVKRDWCSGYGKVNPNDTHNTLIRATSKVSSDDAEDIFKSKLSSHIKGLPGHYHSLSV